MNIKKNSYKVLGLVLGVSVILYIFDVPIIPSSTQVTPTITIPTIVPTEQIIKTTIASPTPPSLKKVSEIVDYTVGNFPESVSVNITLDGATVTDLQLSLNPSNDTSAAYQNAFAAEIKSYVVGKNIKDINVSRVAGASYTTEAFMQAVKKIQANT
ncbi:MAG: FMN-binding protein [bacterium]